MGTPDRAQVTVIDNDPTSVTLARSGTGAIAEDGTATLTVSLGRRLYAGESVSAPLAVSGSGITAPDYTLTLASGTNVNDDVTLATGNPHSAATPAVVFTGDNTDTVRVATLTLTAQDDSDDEGTSETLSDGFVTDTTDARGVVMSNLDRESGLGAAGTTSTGTVAVVITDNDDDPALSAGTITATGAVLTLRNNPATWYYKRTQPTAGACTTVTGATATLTSLTASTSYTYAAWSNSGCTTALAGSPSVTFATTAVTDTTAPRVTSIARQTPNTSPTNADSLTWRVTFSEAVRNVDAADFTRSGTSAPLSVAVVSTTVYDVTASGGNLAGLNGTVTLGFAGNQNIRDAAGNALTNTTPTSTHHNSYVLDNTAPTLTISVPPTSTAAFTATFTFSEAVTGFALSDITVGNGSASGFTAVTANRAWRATITPQATGAVTVDVGANVATDTAGNGNGAAARASSTYTAPTPSAHGRQHYHHHRGADPEQPPRRLVL